MYGPDVTKAIQPYANHFDDLSVAERTPLIDLNAVNFLLDHRETWQNAFDTPDEHRIEVSDGVDDRGYIETDEHGQYPAGYEVQVGMGTRVPTNPVNDEEMRWGYYDVDANGDPLNGFYYGVDSTDLFVAKARDGVVEKVYRENWDDQADGSGNETTNPSDLTLSLDKGNIFQIEFTYYGYGPVEMQVVFDEKIVTLYTFLQDGNTSINNTNLPLRQEVVSNGTNSDNISLYVGGRQYSIMGKETTNNRAAQHYRDSITGVDDTRWYAAITITLKDGTDIGSKDFTHILSEVFSWAASNDNAPKRWQVRRGVTLNGTPTWVTPTSHEGHKDETGMKVDTTVTDIGDGSGNPTGVFLDGGILAAGSNKREKISQDTIEGRVTADDTVSLVFKAQPGETGAVNSIVKKWEEKW